LGNENEWLYIYCQEQLQKEHFDYFVFGHRHLPLDLSIIDQARYINLGDWLHYFTYLEIGSEGGELKKWL
jgi:UDP-2,3-diacylglucosamine hydrolase